MKKTHKSPLYELFVKTYVARIMLMLMLMHFIFLKNAHLHDLFHKELGLAIRVCATPCSMILVDWKVFGFTISVMNMLNKNRNFVFICVCIA